MRTLVTLALLAAAITPALAQDGSTLVADVADEATGVPLIGAQVRLIELHRDTRAETMGVAAIRRVPQGVMHVQARFVGYEPLTSPVIFSGHDSVEVVLLMHRVQLLDTIVVRAERVAVRDAGFERRGSLGLGRFLTEEQLFRDGDRDLLDVLTSRLPGVRAMWNPNTNEEVLVSLRGAGSMSGSPCPLAVVVDDRPALDADISYLRAEDVTGIELYSATNVPVELRGLAGPNTNWACGLIAISTR